MRRDLPTPDAILEELADKAAAQIDRLAPVAFDGALRELIRYHKFLLHLMLHGHRMAPPSTMRRLQEPPGIRLTGSGYASPRRGVERAANRLSDDDQFIRLLAYVSHGPASEQWGYRAPITSFERSSTLARC